LSNRLVVRQGFDLLVSDLVARAAEELILVRPDGFEPPTPWFEEVYSMRRKSLKNKSFWHFDCATEPPVTPSYALEIADTGTFH
jgi:hypothetical protein